MPTATPYFQLHRGAKFDRRPRITPSGVPISTGSSANAGVFQELYCTAGGSNLNSGDDENATAYYTTTNGSWDNVTKIFTPTDGTNPAAAGVQAGKFVSTYIDGALLTTLIGLVSTVENKVNGRIFVNTVGTAGPGTASGATGRTLKAGGAWLGPIGPVSFPLDSGYSFTLIVTQLQGKWTRINFRNDRVYSNSAAPNLSSSQMILQGYSVTPGDGGKANLDQTNPGAATVLQLGAGSNSIVDMIFSADTIGIAGLTGLATSSQHSWVVRCIFRNLIGSGGTFGNSGNVFIECEAYNCGNNAPAGGGFVLTSNCGAYYCVSHHSPGGNGFVNAAGSNLFTYHGCISASNWGAGFLLINSVFSGFNMMQHCDAYGNGRSGFHFNNETAGSQSAQYLIRNCNSVKNGRYGMEFSGFTTGRVTGFMQNCGFGTGEQAKNAAGFYTGTDMMFLTGEKRYTPDVTPWLDPSILRFDTILPEALAAGAGSFTITQPGQGPTVGYPDIGAAQAQGSVTFWAGSDFDLPYGYIGYSYVFDWLFPLAENISLVGGVLPPGLSITQVSTTEWKIAGTPTVLGSYTATLRATIGTSFGDATFNITILADPDEGTGFASNF